MRWLRNGKAIKGETNPKHAVGVPDVGAKLEVRMTLRREGYRTRKIDSRKVRGLHRVPARHASPTRSRPAAGITRT